MSLKIRKLRIWISRIIPPLLWMLLIFWWSSLPNLKTGEGPPHWVLRKSAHLIEYAVLFLLWRRAFNDQPYAKQLAASIAFLYGISDEIHQLFVPTRAPKISDIFFDLGGIILGFLIASFRVTPPKGATLLGLNPVLSRSAEQTRKLAADLAKSLHGGTILALAGELGSGKTTFVQGLAQGLGIKELVTSPTFILQRSYPVPQQKIAKAIITLYHFDLYRLTPNEDLQDSAILGLSEACLDPSGLVVIEWAEKIKEILPPRTTWVYFENLGEEKRKVVITR